MAIVDPRDVDKKLSYPRPTDMLKTTLIQKKKQLEDRQKLLVNIERDKTDIAIQVATLLREVSDLERAISILEEFDRLPH